MNDVCESCPLPFPSLPADIINYTHHTSPLKTLTVSMLEVVIISRKKRRTRHAGRREAVAVSALAPPFEHIDLDETFVFGTLD